MNFNACPPAQNATELVDKLRGLRVTLAPGLKKAATYVLEHPTEFSLDSIRASAKGADVKPNAFVRLASTLGFEGFEEMRAVFREEMRQSSENFPDKARRLQNISAQNQLSDLQADLAGQLHDNIDDLVKSVDHEDLREAARSIVNAKRTFVLGVGVANAAVQNFAYVASMALDNVFALPNGGMLPADRLAHATLNDILIAVTFAPFRTEVIDAVNLAREIGVPIIGITDISSNPMLVHAKHKVIVPVQTPQFFTSTVGLTAFFEMLTAFVIAEAGDDAVAKIKAFHAQRYRLGVYAGPPPHDTG